jgi:hypothetical protein
MKTRVTVAALTILLCSLAQRCKQENVADTQPVDSATTGAVAPPVTRVPITVTIRTTGVSHLLDGDQPDKKRLLIVPAGISGHDLLLLAPDAYTTTLLDKREERVIGTKKVWYKYRYFPAGYEIDLMESGWTQAANPTLDLTEDGDKPNAECPSNSNATSLHWLPSISTVNHDPVTVKETHKKKNPLPRDVLTRMEINGGVLLAEVRTAPYRFEFDTTGVLNDRDHVQAVADYLVYTFTAMVEPNEPFVLKGRVFGGTTLQNLATVVPKGNRVSIILANVVKTSFFKPSQSPTIPHFVDHYYDILDKPNKKVKKVEKVGVTCDHVSPNDSGVECGPARVNG